MFEVSKQDKKICRMLIERGLQLEYVRSLVNVEDIVRQWRSGKLSNRDAYMNMFNAVKRNDKHIARRYDGLGGSRYPYVVAALLADGLITEADLAEMQPRTREAIMIMATGYQ
ncbi:hypothetical protein [Parapedobacter soli]|uniref:hypothetical protein n=1 Tax=Parapedobacter soli TaxID=416955 RepID=UPI0021C74183|nr:hypothetical protein [Parapedobacter soli]